MPVPLTGCDIDARQLLEIAERLHTLLWMFSLRAGFAREDDRLRAQARAVPEFDKYRNIPETGIAGNENIMKYHLARDWDAEAGIPIHDAPERLGLL